MTYQLEEGVPVPTTRRGGGVRKSKYPFSVMEPNQSFLAGADTKAGTVRSAVGAFLKRNPGFGKFAVRETAEGVRVWRVQ